MKLPDGSTLMHGRRPYDPQKAHEYYMRTRKLKGRRKGSAQVLPGTAKVAAKVNAKQKKAQIKTTEQKLASIRAKLELLKRGGGKSDYATRTAAEKQAEARKQKAKQAAAAEEVQSVRKELSDLNQALKRRVSEKAPASQVEALRSSIEEAQGRLDEAVEKLKNSKATKSG